MCEWEKAVYVRDNEDRRERGRPPGQRPGQHWSSRRVAITASAEAATVGRMSSRKRDQDSRRQVIDMPSMSLSMR